MQRLIEKISIRIGIDKNKATEALLVITDHVKVEFPLLHSVVDLILGTQKLSEERKQPIIDLPPIKIIYN
jgi:hypothetical protein